MRMTHRASISCAATLMALSTACLVFGYALFLMPPSEAATNPATWLCSLVVATATYLGTLQPKPLR